MAYVMPIYTPLHSLFTNGQDYMFPKRRLITQQVLGWSWTHNYVLQCMIWNTLSHWLSISRWWQFSRVVRELAWSKERHFVIIYKIFAFNVATSDWLSWFIIFWQKEPTRLLSLTFVFLCSIPQLFSYSDQ